MRKLNGGDLVARALINEGVEYIFTIGGERMLTIYDALYRKSPITLIVPRSEAASIPSTGTALQDNIPVLSITPTVQGWKMDPIQENLHGCEQADLLASVTKWNVVVRHWKKIPKLIQYGFREMLTGRKGPVHLDIHYEILFAYNWISKRGLKRMMQKSGHTRFQGEIRGDDAMIKEAAGMIVQAKKPLIISGGEVTEHKAWKELENLVNYLKIPVLTTKRSKGTLSHSHTCNIGGSECLTDSHTRNLLLQSDSILVMGCAPAELKEFECLFDRHIKIIQVDIDPSYIGFNNIEIPIIGDARSVLRDFLEYVKKSSPSIDKETSWGKQLHDSKTAWINNLNEKIKNNPTHMHPGFLAKEIRGLLNNDAVIIYDGASAAFWGGIYCPPYLPAAGFVPADMDVGAGLPMSLGSQLASPARQVCTFIQGTSFLYSTRELETAKRYNLHTLTIVLNDSQKGDVDYANIAKGFKCFGERVKDHKELKAAFLRAKESGLPAVLDVQVTL